MKSLCPDKRNDNRVLIKLKFEFINSVRKYFEEYDKMYDHINFLYYLLPNNFKIFIFV